MQDAQTFPPLDIVTFQNKTHTKTTARSVPWPKLIDTLTTHKHRAQKDGPGFSPARYKDGATRGNDGVEALSCYVADIDDGTTAADLWDRWKTADGQPLAYVLYSTFQSTRERPRWRVVFPLAAPVPAAEWPCVWRKLTAALTDGRSDPATKDPARFSYFPACPAELQDEAFAEQQQAGAWLHPDDYPDPPQEDLADRMADSMRKREARDGKPVDSGTGKPGEDFNRRATIDDVVSLLEKGGWRECRRRGDAVYVTRPGKLKDVSGVVGFPGDSLPIFYCFTSSAPPFSVRAYAPFGVYALVEHQEDFGAAAKTLGEQGYGEPRSQKQAGKQTTGKERKDAPKDAGPGVSKDAAQEAHRGRAAQDAPGDAWEDPIPFGTLSLPPFPIEALPPTLAAFVSEVAASTQVPADMPALLALSALATAGGRRAVVAVGRTHTETMNLFVACVMEPGSRKSQTLEAIVAPLREAEQQIISEKTPHVRAAKERHELDTKRLAYLRERAVKEKDENERRLLQNEAADLAAELAPSPPSVPRLLADDITQERLSGVLAEQEDNSLAIFSAEGGIFGMLAGRYSSSGGVNLDLLLKAYSGEPFKSDRIGRAPEYVQKPTVTIGLAVQPDVLASLADSPSFRGRGLLGRFLYALPHDLVGTRQYADRPVDPQARADYHTMLHALLALPSPVTPDNPAARHTLTINGEALQLWKEYQDAVEQRMADDGDLSGIRDWGSKLGGAVARLAGGMHLAQHAHDARPPWQTPVSEATVLAAWAIGEYLIPHALAAYGKMGADPTRNMAQRVLRWIGRASIETFGFRDCLRVHGGVKADELESALALLCDHGYLRVDVPAAKPGPGRPPRPVYVVNPACAKGRI